ncbi:NNT, partial [Symbiodinium pilosum]
CRVAVHWHHAAAATMMRSWRTPRGGQSERCRLWLRRLPLAVLAIGGGTMSGTQCEVAPLPTGRWRLDKARSESMRPYFAGLGLPGFVARIIDHVPVDLHIRVEEKILTVVDKTLFGENSTTIELGGLEVEKETRNKRKKFMLSAFEETSEGLPELTVKCRLFQRGDGWHSLQSFTLLQEGSLRERYILQRPGESDIVVTRVFRSLDARPEQKESALSSPRSSGNSIRLLGGVGLLAGFLATALCVQ